MPTTDEERDAGDSVVNKHRLTIGDPKGAVLDVSTKRGELVVYVSDGRQSAGVTLDLEYARSLCDYLTRFLELEATHAND